MATSSDPYNGLSRFLSTLGAAVIFLMGLLFAVMSFFLLKDADFQAMNNIVAADAGWVGQPALSYDLDKAAIGIVIIGVFAMLAACVGCCGAQLESHSFICTYCLSVVALVVWLLMTWISVLNFDTILVPIADRQATTFCNVSHFYTFKAKLGCKFPASRPGGPCGADCLDRVSLLREMGGCNLLSIMCHSYEWESVGPGLCLAAAVNAPSVAARPPTWQSQSGILMSSDTCQQACSEHVSCSSSSFNAATQVCFLSMRLPPVTHGKWTIVASDPASPIPATEAASPVMGADGNAAYACSKKDKPAVIARASAVAQLLVWCSGMAVLISSLAMCCTCSLLYSTSTRRKGKKGAGALVHKLLCPWAIGTAQRQRRKFVEEEDAVE